MEIAGQRGSGGRAGRHAIVVAAEFPPDHFGGGGAFAASLVRALQITYARVDVVVNTPAATNRRIELSPGAMATYVGLRAKPHLSAIGPDAKVVWGATRTARVLRDLDAKSSSILISVDYFSAVAALSEGLHGPKLALACLQSAAGRAAAGIASADEPLRLEVERACAETGWTFLCPSEAERTAVASAHPQANVQLLYPALDPATESFAKGLSREKGGSGGLIGYVGRLAAEKAPDRLLAIAEQMRDSSPLELVVITGDRSSPAASQLRSLGITVREWLDRESLLRFYGELDALLLPSRYESFGLVALEAAAAGAAVVLSLETGANEILAPHPGVIQVDCDEPVQVVQALLEASEWRRSALGRYEFDYPNDRSFARALFAVLHATSNLE